MKNWEQQATPESHDISVDNPLLVIEYQNTPELPSSFRRSDDSYRRSAALDLNTTRQTLPPAVCVVDLRQEPHGFINGIPVSWYGLRNWTYAEKSGEAIEQLENELITQLN